MCFRIVPENESEQPWIHDPRELLDAERLTEAALHLKGYFTTLQYDPEKLCNSLH